MTGFYRNTNAEGDWGFCFIPDNLTKEWRNYCCRLALLNSNDPNPYFDDYVNFLKENNYEHRKDN